MERRNINGKDFIIGYHCQEFRVEGELEQPILCNTKDAWLGIGYYFWVDIKFARFWGEDFKKKNTGYYDIYEASLNTENCINATFDEQGYYFYKSCIEDAINYYKTNNEKVTLSGVNRFLKENFWDKMGITGIIYDDLPMNPYNKPARQYSEIEVNEKTFFYYHKRIQIAIFQIENIHNFEILLEEQQ